MNELTYKAEPGRPASSAGRPDKELRCYDLLDGLQIKYTRVDHAPAETIDSCGQAEEALGIRICKNLFLCNTQKTNFYLLIMPGDKKFKTSVFSKQMGCARLSFAPAEYMEQFLDITPGSVSVLGLMNDKENRVRLVIDEDVLKEPAFGCHPCINTSSLRIATEDLITQILPAIHHSLQTVSLP